MLYLMLNVVVLRRIYDAQQSVGVRKMPPTIPYEQARTAFEAADRANLSLFLALDNAVSFGHMTQLSTSVLHALDYARECAAKLFVYLAEPTVKVVEAGPTEDHDLLTVGEYDRRVLFE